MRIIINNRKDWLSLKERHRSVKKAYMSKALSFRLNTELALRIRQDALSLPSAELIEYHED